VDGAWKRRGGGHGVGADGRAAVGGHGACGPSAKRSIACVWSTAATLTLTLTLSLCDHLAPVPTPPTLPTSAPPRGYVRVSGRANTPSWVYWRRAHRPTLEYHQLRCGSSTHSPAACVADGCVFGRTPQRLDASHFGEHLQHVHDTRCVRVPPPALLRLLKSKVGGALVGCWFISLDTRCTGFGLQQHGWRAAERGHPTGECDAREWARPPCRHPKNQSRCAF
jgi:hypothetical protein